MAVVISGCIPTSVYHFRRFPYLLRWPEMYVYTKCNAVDLRLKDVSCNERISKDMTPCPLSINFSVNLYIMYAKLLP